MSHWMRVALQGLFLLFTSFFFATLAVANTYESFENIKKTAQEFLAKNITAAPDETIDVRVIATNPPLQVAACSKPIEAALPADSNKNQITAVDLTCNGDKNWHALVPVVVTVNTKVVVAKHMIPSNQAITEDDLDYASYDRNQLFNGYFKKVDDIVGQVASQSIAAGTVLSKHSVQLPILIHRNEVVEIVARSNSVTVSMQGVAKSDGSLNQTIKVYNPSSKRTLDAIVIGSNKAEAIS